ncbi:MAG: HupE/UreJ family protein [Hyphomicrobiaceae bacterium]|nr:HupE/UreJ family protein [Hyphomicrobiaceae bacterium]
MRRIWSWAVFFILALLAFLPEVRADVVKPALIEVSADVLGHTRIEVRASLEALLTGINARYKNTKNAPTADQYDVLRKLDGSQLAEKFKPFQGEFLKAIALKADGRKVPLTITRVKIEPAGYTKVPRISLIVLEGPLDRDTKALSFYYPERFADYAVRVRQVDEQAGKYHWSQWQWVRDDLGSQSFSLADLFTRRPLHKVVWSYMSIGYVHILPKGTDHILFIVGLFLFSARWRPLLSQVTMFTLAHTLTLGLTMGGYIQLSDRIVEPLIALSIAYVGLENIFNRGKTIGWGRLAMVFGFGLLHGMGFARMLAEFGMPPKSFFTALFSFNIGVELGQLTIIAGAYALLGHWFGEKPWYRQRIIIPASAIITIVALYWVVERLEWL